MNLTQYDLNLLVMFQTIFKERNLTRAGETLNLSQPAVSQGLGRLRDTFDDPLFVRSGNEMVPTAVAERLSDQIKEILELSEKVFTDPGAFDPVTSDRCFRLAMSDYTEMILMPKLFSHIQETGPNIRIHSRHLSQKDYRSALENGDLDVIIASDLEFGSNVFKQALFTDREVCIVRSDSLALNEELTADKYASFKHAQFSCHWLDHEVNHIELALEQLNLKRVIPLEVQHEMVLPLILRDNDLLVNMPERMAREFKTLLPIEIIDIPLSLSEYQFDQYWHARNHHDPAHQWLRTEIKTVCDTL